MVCVADDQDSVTSLEQAAGNLRPDERFASPLNEQWLLALISHFGTNATLSWGCNTWRPLNQAHWGGQGEKQSLQLRLVYLDVARRGARQSHHTSGAHAAFRLGLQLGNKGFELRRYPKAGVWRRNRH